MTRKTGLSRTLASCTHRRANTPFGKMRPQYAIENGKLCVLLTCPMEMTARRIQATPIEKRTYAPRKQPAKIIWPASWIVGNVSPMCSGRSSERSWPFTSSENPPCPSGPSVMNAERMRAGSGGPLVMRRRRYTVIIMIAKLRPMMTIEKENAEVRSAMVVETGMNACERRPPDDDATMRVTTGSSQVAAIFGMECS